MWLIIILRCLWQIWLKCALTFLILVTVQSRSASFVIWSHQIVVSDALLLKIVSLCGIWSLIVLILTTIWITVIVELLFLLMLVLILFYETSLTFRCKFTALFGDLRGESILLIFLPSLVLHSLLLSFKESDSSLLKLIYDILVGGCWGIISLCCISWSASGLDGSFWLKLIFILEFSL